MRGFVPSALAPILAVRALLAAGVLGAGLLAPAVLAPAPLGRTSPGPLPLDAQEAGCPEPVLGPPAGIVAPDSSERSSAYWSSGNGLERRNVGVGSLEVEEPPAPAGPPAAHDWLPRITLPLWFRPSDDGPGAWIHRGWWLPAGSPDERIALTYRGMVETGYESSRLIVTRARGDGWLEVWVDIGPVDRAATGGLVWTHRCLLDRGEVALEYVPWSEAFLGPEAPPLSFRDTVRHALRERGHPEAPPVVWLEPRDEVELLEIEGDWARVRATRPGVYATGCRGETWEGEVFEGWVQWRDDERGTWLWYPTRGC